jgi:serine phosphatase RsbU (regulator of sigma subunit)/tetratricopeptide (TPR) repeat protein
LSEKKYFIFIFTLILIGPVCLAQNKRIDSLKSALSAEKNDTNRIKILNNIINGTNDDNVWPQYNLQIKTIAEKNLKLNLSKELIVFYQKYLGDVYNNFGYIDEQKGKLQRALENYFKAKKLYHQANDRLGLAENLNNLAVLYDNQGRTTEALEMHTKCLSIMEQIHNEEGMARSYNNIGIIFQKQGNLLKAVDYFNRSLVLKEKGGNKNGMAYSFNNLAAVYEMQEDREKALEYWQKSLNLWLEVGNRDGLYSAYNNIAGTYLRSKDFKKAHVYFLKAYQISRDLGDMEGKALSLSSLGQLFFMQNELNRSLGYLKESKALFDSLNNKDHSSMTQNVMCDVYIKQKKYKEAENNALESLKISRQMGFPVNIRDVAKILKNIYLINGNFEKAFQMSNLYIKMNDSLNNLEAKTANIKRDFQYQFDIKAAADSLKNAVLIEKEKFKHEQEIKQQRIFTYGGIVGFIFMLVIAALSFRAYRAKQKANAIIQTQKIEVEKQKNIIEEKQKEIVDSINYAKRIQNTLLAHDEFLKENLDDHFVLFNPKDIVSGDFYWATSVRSSVSGVQSSVGVNSEQQTPNSELFYLAVCDSTGHGVPGAFMSLINIGFLSEAIKEKGIEQPNEVFNYVRTKLTDNINREGQKDGFDGILLCLKSKTKKSSGDGESIVLTYAAANNKPVIVYNDQLQELSTDKMPVGLGERKEGFKLNRIEAQPGSMIYLYTDGYADQFGGEKGKKFKYKPFNELLLTINKLPLTEQREILNQKFTEWKGNLEQVDDVCIVGIRL